MIKHKENLTASIFAIIITFLFHKKPLGLNLLIAELVLFTWLLFTKQFRLKGIYPITIGLGFIVSAFATVFIYSAFAFIVHFVFLFTLVGLLIYPQTKSLVFSLGHALSNIPISQYEFVKNFSQSDVKGQKLGLRLRKVRIFIIPIFIIGIFTAIYSSSNPVFNDLVIDLGTFFQESSSFIFQDLDLSIIFTFVISLLISIFIFIRSKNTEIIEIEQKSGENLIRKRKKFTKNIKFTALKNEYRSGIFLLIALNLMILLLNIIDIQWVWFGFEWQGQYLKQFVHEGTYLLILSILISIALVLYYFRGNLNFYKQNKLLKLLSFIWLAQNGILSISVAIRNFWYIHYFALAYKRIGVFLFLILTIHGLITVYLKVKHRKSAFYLFKTNTHALFIILLFSALFNWDGIIAKYNFKHADKSFLHLDYLSTLSDKTLPELDKPLNELQSIEKNQKQKFPFKQKYMNPKAYKRIIQNRKEAFINKWESKSILSWNLPEYLAYRKLTEQ